MLFRSLLQRVAAAANEAGSIEEAMSTCLELVCSHTGWAVGHGWQVANLDAELGPGGYWYLTDAKRFRAFQPVAITSPLNTPGFCNCLQEPSAWASTVMTGSG